MSDLPKPWTLETTLINACQLIDGWKNKESWSDWDTEVRANLSHWLARIEYEKNAPSETRKCTCGPDYFDRFCPRHGTEDPDKKWAK